MGMLGYKTPNIDRIGREGAVFTDWYGQQSCTAGRAAFITGQSPMRSGLTKVGLPGAPEGMKQQDPTIATLLRAQGYMTGQFGKNHLGDRDDMLPTANGFDEFFGNLYHLNAEEEPENADYPKNPEFKKKFGPRGVIHSFADGRITDTGALTKKRMETIDDEVTAKALDFMARAKQADKPFFIWWNSTRMHIFTHLKKESDGKTGLGIYADGMVEHDGHVRPALRGEAAWPRHDFIYWTDDGQVAALRYDNWKITFLEQKGEGLRVWQEPFTVLRAPLVTNLRMDPFERAEHENAMGFQRWYVEHMFVIAPAAAHVGQWLQSFKDYPPRQKPGSFNLERVMEAVTRPAQN